ncbi:hypothetical protein BDZ91DRAFT_736734, partial [Kalaharituber pfeilii]
LQISVLIHLQHQQHHSPHNLYSHNRHTSKTSKNNPFIICQLSNRYTKLRKIGRKGLCKLNLVQQV